MGSAKMGCLEGAVSIKSRLPVRQDKRGGGTVWKMVTITKERRKKVDQKICYFTDGHCF